MSQKIICLITFDYELPLGRCFVPVEKALFEPTSQILDICDKLNIKVTLFPDVCSVWAHRKYNLNGYADAFEMQLKQALASRHDVQLHLHPHWLNTVYDNNEWLVSTDKMYLNELGYDNREGSASWLINKGVTYLENLLRPVETDYRCSAFRAAGLALQPQEDKLLESLLANGINLDSSVSKGLIMKLDTVTINYSNMPESSYWQMAPESGISRAAKSGVLEIPIASFKSGFIDKYQFLFRRVKSVNKMRGLGISRSKRQTKLATIRTLILQNLRYITSNPRYILSCDTKGFTTKMLLDGLGQYVNRHKNDDMVYLSMINHPKLMFDEQMDMLSSFVENSKKLHDIQFVTCRQALKMINGAEK
jgi:hypothetical protein